MNLSELKQLFRSKLGSNYSDSELKQLIKVVVSNKLNISDSEYILLNNQHFTHDDKHYFMEVCDRLEKGEPFQYVIGGVYFAGLELKSDKRALIPRPETEELVDWIIKDNSGSDKRLSIVDLCTGSGCIALGVKNFIRNSYVVGVDYSHEAIELAKENAVKTGLDVEFICGDVLRENWLKELEKENFDIWVSNPPYIPYTDKQRMEANVLEFEPHMALFVEDENPLVFYKAIALQAMKYLKSKGALYFEIHEELSGDVVQLLNEVGFVNIEVRKDLQGKDRMIRSIK